MYVDTGQIQFVLQHLFQILSHLLLLRHSAVVLYGQDHWVPGGWDEVIIPELPSQHDARV